MIKKVWDNGLGTKTLAGVLIALTIATIGTGYKALESITILEQRALAAEQALIAQGDYFERRLDVLERRIDIVDRRTDRRDSPHT